MFAVVAGEFSAQSTSHAWRLTRFVLKTQFTLQDNVFIQEEL